jgi:hypothetical protein
MHTKTTIKVSETVKQKIMDELVEPCFYKDIKALMAERTIWRKSGNIFETFSKLFVGAASILSFATGFNFWSGTSSVLSLVCMQFSSFSHSESKERSNKMNKLLDKLKVENVPDISSQTNLTYAASQSQLSGSYYYGSSQQQSPTTYYPSYPYPSAYPMQAREPPIHSPPLSTLQSSRKNSIEAYQAARAARESKEAREIYLESLEALKDPEIKELKKTRAESLDREEALRAVEEVLSVSSPDDMKVDISEGKLKLNTSLSLDDPSTHV